MAFTEQNKADAYLFFVLAFNAAPGTVYGGQIVEAYESGMTTAEIVAQYTSKDAFKAIYPDSQTAAEFAAALVGNVVSATNPAAAKTAAIADIEKALADGWSKAQVITQILGNLANKTVADADWGPTVAQLNNKIEVAKVLTEGAKALNTTDVDTLTGPLKNVTEAVSTVQDAINGAGPLADKIETLNAANKAEADFIKSLDLKAPNDTVAKVLAAASAKAVTDISADFSSLVNGKETVSAAAQAAIVVAAKQKNADALAAAKTDLETAKTDFLKANETTATKAEVDAYVSAFIANTAASDKLGTGVVGTPALGDEGAIKAANDAQTALSVATQLAQNGFDATDAKIDPVTGTVAATAGDIITVQSGSLALASAFVSKASAAQLTAAQDLLVKIIAQQNAKVAADAADAALDAAGKALGNGTTPTMNALDTAIGGVASEQTKAANLDKALTSYQAAAANSTKEAALLKAIEDAKKAFEDAGQKVPGTLGVDATTGDADIFLVSAKDSTGKTVAGFAAGDKIYAGKDYTVNADIAKGDDAKLEVFFKANGANTDVYIEQKAFGSNTAAAADGNGDFVKVTLTGVAADKLVLKDGFVTIAG